MKLKPTHAPRRPLARPLAISVALSAALSASLSAPLIAALAPRLAPRAEAAPASVAWVGALLAHPAVQMGLPLVGDLVLERTGAKRYLKRQVQHLLPRSLESMAGPALEVAGEVAGDQLKRVWCAALPMHCRKQGQPVWKDVGRLLTRHAGVIGALSPVVNMISAAKISRQVSRQAAALQAALVQGDLALGALMFVSIAHSEYSRRALLSELERMHAESLAELRRLSEDMTRQLVGLKESLARIEQRLADDLKRQVDGALVCAAGFSRGADLNVLGHCLSELQGARLALAQRGYTPELELDLLAMELRLLTLAPVEQLDPQRLRVIWSAASSLPRPDELREALAGAVCEGAEAARCGEGWRGEGLARRLRPLREHLARQGGESFEGRRGELAEALLGLLALNSREELDEFTRGAGRLPPVEGASARARRWVEEQDAVLEGSRAETLRLRVSLVPQIDLRELSASVMGEAITPELEIERARLVYSFDITPGAAPLEAEVALTYKGYLGSWVTRCRLALDPEGVAQMSRQPEPLTGVLDCTQHGEEVPRALSYSVRSSFAL